MTKYTPGLWKHDDTSIYSDKYEHDIATLYFEHGEPYSLEEFEANANLIAAAPELLEALEDIINANGMYEERIVNAKKAIAKAKGEK